MSFDRINSLSLSCIEYPQDSLSHLQVKKGMESVPYEISYDVFGGPEELFCPAHVYEYVTTKDGTVQFQIHSENCLHCKTCVAKTPKGFIQWNVPSSGGPNYSNM